MICTYFSAIITIFLLICFPANAKQSTVLNLDDAYQYILEVNFGLKSTEAKVQAKKGEKRQAGASPNPSLEIELEDIGRMSGGSENELFVGITQVVETAGKRSARIRVANADLCMADWEYETEKKDLLAEIVHSFITMASVQERVALAQKQEKIAEHFFSAVVEKLRFGKSSAIEQKRAEIALKTAKINLNRQKANLNKAKRELASLWNNTPPLFDEVSFPLYRLHAPPTLEMLNQQLEASPVLAQAAAKTTRATEIVSLEKAQRIPDVALTVGVTAEKFVQEPALAVGFAMPIPIFNSNKGNINRAYNEQIQAIYEQMDTEASLKAELAAHYEDWIGSYEQATALREAVLPTADESFQLAQTGYNEGKFNYLQYLDANSTFIDVREQYLDAITEYHHKRTEVLRLIAACSCDEFQEEQQ